MSAVAMTVPRPRQVLDALEVLEASVLVSDDQAAGDHALEVVKAALRAPRLHEIAVAILDAFEDTSEALSPSMLSRSLEEKIGNVSYHVRVLVDRGLLTLVDTQPRRGAVEHYYRPVV